MIQRAAKTPQASVVSQAGSLAARLRQRIFPPSLGHKPDVSEREAVPGRLMSFNARIAELLLVNRLKARAHPRSQASEILERAAHIVFVTCKNWFSSGDGKTPEQRTPL